jgi:valyl-tRNA synthetase
MSNIKDWCISRQLWWGHRIPVWYHKDTGEVYCNFNPPQDPENWRQDEDVLDTWASSWLWAFEIFKTEEDQDYYYPTDTLVTAPDIIFFWVARMIMAGLHFKNVIPFKDVYFTSIIRDIQGRKMSKSLGNSPDPLEVIKDYGADALRFTVIYLAPLGQDVLFSTDKCEIGRNFANKVWNAGRFLLMNRQNINTDPAFAEKHLDFSDQWINSRFSQALQQLNEAMEKFEINNAAKIVYSYVWSDFCDWYIELMKNRLYSGSDEVKSAVLTRALINFENLLKIVHPFMPFITEELWQLIAERNDGESISTSDFPRFNSELINPAAEKEMEFVQDVITAIRNIRGEMNIPPSRMVAAYVRSSQVAEHQVDYIKKLARVQELKVESSITKPKASASSVIRNTEIFVPLEGLIDLDVERNRLQKEITRLEGALAGIEKKLSNEKFIQNAAPEVVGKERAKKKDWEINLEKLKINLQDLN